MSIEPITEEFIGREQEIDYFTHWLTDSSAPSVIFLHDALEEPWKKGGIGKTWLLNRLYNLVETDHPEIIPVTIDFFNVMDRDGVVVAERVVQALQRRFPHWEPERFLKILQEYHETVREELMETVNMREHMGDALTDDLRILQGQLHENKVSILLFFDTFELVERHLVSAVLDPAHTFPDFYHFSRFRAIIAGRNAPDWTHPNWAGREHEIEVRPLKPFDFADTVHYLRVHSYVHDIESLAQETLHALHERSEGRPILVGLITDVLNKRIKTPQTLISISRAEFEASLVEEINNFDDPSRWAVFTMAHVYHRFNATLLSLLMNRPGLKGLVPEMEYQELLEAIPRLSFVRRSTYSDDFVLHDEMRRLVNKYCWEKQDPDERIRRDLSMLAVEYYTALIADEEREEVRQSYIAETLFHQLFINIDEGLRYFEQYFDRSLASSRLAFARALFQELHKFAERLSHEQKLKMMLDEAALLQEELNPRAALALYQQLEGNSPWEVQHRGVIFFEKSSCYVKLSQFGEAEKCIAEGLEIERFNKNQIRYSRLYNLLGYIHRRRGQYDEAMRYYEECLKIQRNLDDLQNYAATLNNMGNVLRLQNKLEESLRFCKLALRNRRDLYKQGKARELDVGLSLSTIGHTYNALDELVEAERAYQEAFNIYKRYGDKRSLAAAYNSLGRVHYRKGELEKALEDYRQGARIAAGASHESEIQSYAEQGRVLVELERWQEAIEYCDHALEIARRVGQNHQIAKNLLTLAEALDQTGQSAFEQLKEAKHIARDNSYNDLLGRAAEIQGDMSYRRQEYQSAFKYYRVACRFMALRGSPDFDRFLRKLNDVLLDVPNSFLPGVIDSLLEYWFALGLDREYPQLVSACKEVIRHMVLY